MTNIEQQARVTKPRCQRCNDTNDIGHEPGAFTDALGYGPPCPDCERRKAEKAKRKRK